MPRLILSRRAVADIQRCRQFLADRDDAAADRAAKAISNAILLLTTTPAAGRPIAGGPGFRELIIPFGATGYVALYAYDPADDAVLILERRA